MPESPVLSPRPDLEPDEVIQRARNLWRTCLVLPFVYITLAVFVDRLFFKSGVGFWPMQASSYHKVLVGFVVTAFLIQFSLGFLHHTFQKRLRSVRLLPAKTADLYWKRTLYMAICADAVSGLGLIAFLIHADWGSLTGFCIFSYILYIQAYPRARFLER